MHSSIVPLVDLLRTLFTTEELRHHLYRGRDGQALVDGLPGTSASHEAYAHAAALTLVRRGLLDEEFFAGLIAARPQRSIDIQRAQDAWLAAGRHASGLVLGGRYRLDAQLGEGGVASVWRAVDDRTGQVVAVKLLHPRHEDDPRIRRRFFRGAATLTELRHPAIVRVFTAVEEDGRRCFYAMEYVTGTTLDDCVRACRHPTNVLIALALQVGDALAHVHRHGLLHRDVKPANILVVGPDNVRLIDFDLVTGEDFVAQTTQAVGTGIYMPPEAHTTDRKTAAYDVYSLARTIEFVLRGRDPTARELFDVTDLPSTADVRAILRAALHTDPQRRISDMATFCTALRAALAEPRPTSPPATPADDLDPAAAPPPWRATAIASIAASAVGILWAPSAEAALPILFALTVPNARVLIDREDNVFLNVMHYLWVAVWCIMVLVLVPALLGITAKTQLKTFPALVFLAALGFGLHASIIWLRRPRPTD
jgi:tRNA A-37 threonylcarbamoyl transferase component Bud32